MCKDMRSTSHLVRVILMAGLVAVLGTAADPAISNGTGAASHRSNTQSAAVRVPIREIVHVLMKTRRWHEAREILERLEPEAEDEQIERLFLLGIAEVQLGNLPEAAERFETILADRPDLTRVRLELARVYGLMGRDEKARFHFEASLADRLPSSVEDAVETWLDQIDARKRWSVSLSVAFMPESNPVGRTDEEEVRIGGVPFQLDEDARAASGTGLLVNAGTQYSPVIGNDWRGVLAASGAAKLYRNSDWNDTSVQGDIGVARLFDSGSASGGLRLGWGWLGGDHYSTSIGPWVRGRARLSPALRLDAVLGMQHRDHPDRPDRDGWTVSVRPGMHYALNAQTAFRTELDLEHVEAREDRNGSRLGGFAVGVSHAFEDGFSVSSRAAFRWRRYAARDPLFGKTRSDRHLRLSVNLLHRKVQYHGFAPYIGGFVERNRSNIVINSYRNLGGLLGISKTF